MTDTTTTDDWEAPHAPYSHEGQHARIAELLERKETTAARALLQEHLSREHGRNRLLLDEPLWALQDDHERRHEET